LRLSGDSRSPTPAACREDHVAAGERPAEVDARGRARSRRGRRSGASSFARWRISPLTRVSSVSSGIVASPPAGATRARRSQEPRERLRCGQYASERSSGLAERLHEREVRSFARRGRVAARPRGELVLVDRAEHDERELALVVHHGGDERDPVLICAARPASTDSRRRGRRPHRGPARRRTGANARTCLVNEVGGAPGSTSGRSRARDRRR